MESIFIKASSLNDADLKEFKRGLHLPVKKELVYFKETSFQNFEPFNISDFEIIKKLETSYVLKVTLENGECVDILSDYFAEMQKSNFLQNVISLRC